VHTTILKSLVKKGSCEFCSGWSQTAVLVISASQVAIGMSHNAWLALVIFQVESSVFAQGWS
jgi:hypothetical protein